MSDVESAHCGRTVAEEEATSLAEFYGISSAKAETLFCDRCMRTVASEAPFSGGL